jgi:hypothetical protein
MTGSLPQCSARSTCNVMVCTILVAASFKLFVAGWCSASSQHIKTHPSRFHYHLLTSFAALLPLMSAGNFQHYIQECKDCTQYLAAKYWIQSLDLHKWRPRVHSRHVPSMHARIRCGQQVRTCCPQQWKSRLQQCDTMLRTQGCVMTAKLRSFQVLNLKVQSPLSRGC